MFRFFLSYIRLVIDDWIWSLLLHNKLVNWTGVVVANTMLILSICGVLNLSCLQGVCNRAFADHKELILELSLVYKFVKDHVKSTWHTLSLLYLYKRTVLATRRSDWLRLGWWISLLPLAVFLGECLRTYRFVRWVSPYRIWDNLVDVALLMDNSSHQLLLWFCSSEGAQQRYVSSHKVEPSIDFSQSQDLCERQKAAHASHYKDVTPLYFSELLHEFWVITVLLADAERLTKL